MKTKITTILFNIAVFLGLTNLSDNRVVRFTKKNGTYLGQLILSLGCGAIIAALSLFLTMILVLVISNIDPSFYPNHNWGLPTTFAIAAVIVISFFVTAKCQCNRKG